MAIAIFDLDHTIISVDSNYSFANFLLKKDIVLNKDRFLKIAQSSKNRYESGTEDLEGAVGFTRNLISPLIGKSVEEVEIMVSEFIDKIIKKSIYKEAVTKMKEHKQNKDVVIIESASCSITVNSISKLFDVDHTISTIAQVRDGAYTGELEGIIPYKDGKVDALKKLLEQKSIKNMECYFYSDSINDLPLLQSVKYPIATNPDTTLRKIATKRGWETLDFNNKDAF